MIRRRRRNPLAAVLWVNAGLLGAILVALLARGSGSPSLVPAAFAEQAPIAGGGGVFVMPGQLAERTWGCYLLDIDKGTLVTYQYEPANRQMRLVAARGYRQDTFLHDFGTYPPTGEVKKWVDRERQGVRVPDEASKPADPEKPPENP